MQLSVKINDNSVAEKILWFLNSFSNKGVVVKEVTTNSAQEERFSDEFIEKNWEQILSDQLENYDESDYKSEQYKLDRGEYLMQKCKS